MFLPHIKKGLRMMTNILYVIRTEKENGLTKKLVQPVLFLSFYKLSLSRSCCCIVPVWSAYATAAVCCTDFNALYKSSICLSFIVICPCSVSIVLCKTQTKSETSWFAVCVWFAFLVCVFSEKAFKISVSSCLSIANWFPFFRKQIANQGLRFVCVPSVTKS